MLRIKRFLIWYRKILVLTIRSPLYTKSRVLAIKKPLYARFSLRNFAFRGDIGWNDSAFSSFWTRCPRSPREGGRTAEQNGRNGSREAGHFVPFRTLRTTEGERPARPGRGALSSPAGRPGRRRSVPSRRGSPPRARSARELFKAARRPLPPGRKEVGAALSGDAFTLPCLPVQGRALYRAPHSFAFIGKVSLERADSPQGFSHTKTDGL